MSTPALPGPDVVALVDDLMFLSRIREAAQRLGVSVRPVRRLVDFADSAPLARVVILDLDSNRLPVADALSVLAGSPGGDQLRVGFYSHVNRERAEAARASGCDAVTRGAFVAQLPEILAPPAA